MLKKKKKVMEEARQSYEKNLLFIIGFFSTLYNGNEKKNPLKRELKIRHNGRKTCISYQKI